MAATTCRQISPALGETGSLNDVTDGELNLGPLENNGGPALTQEPGPGSITIGAVPATQTTLCTGTDERGVPRTQGSGCNIGAVEAAYPNITSTSLTEAGGGGPAGQVTFAGTVTDTSNPDSPVSSGTVSLYDNGSSTPFATSGVSAAGTYSITQNYTAAGSHSVVATFSGNTTQAGSSSEPVTFALTPCTTCADTQTIVATVPAGTLAISTPYTAANPLSLGTLTLDPTGSFFTASAPLDPVPADVPTAGQIPDGTFNGVTIVDTQAGNMPWTITAISSNLSDGGANPGSTISGENVGLTNLTAVPVPGNALTPADLTFVNQPGPLPPVGPADTGDQGLGGTTPHLIVQDMTQATGTIGVNSTVTLKAPTSTEAGTFVGTITFTISG